MTDWVTVQEAVDRTGYNPDHLRELIRDGLIVAVKKGNAWWVDEKALNEYVNAAKKSKDKRRGPKQIA